MKFDQISRKKECKSNNNSINQSTLKNSRIIGEGGGFQRHLVITFAVFFMLAVCVFFFLSQTGPISQASKPDDLIVPGASGEGNGTGAYYATAFDGADFWAVGSGGRLARITIDNEVEVQSCPTRNDLHDLCLENGNLLACGKGGVIIRRLDDGTFRATSTGTKADLLEATVFQGSYYVAGEGGILLTSTDGKKWAQHQLPVFSDVIGLEANDETLFAITRESDYLVSGDGVTWQSHNYNEEYQGYANPCVFGSLKNLGDSFFVVGQLQENPDIPFVMFTEDGQVWLSKPMARVNGLEFSELGPLQLFGIGCHLDQLIAVCDSGRLLTVTNCAECNELGKYAEHNLYDLAFGERSMLLVGDEYTHRIVAFDDVRQYKIQPEQAETDYLYNGAVLIDVRSDQEWESGHIAGAIHIPLSDVGNRLPQTVPEKATQLIFYCGSGKRSQTALEEAQELGYKLVYNLGGIDDWPYGLE